jgi:RNA polymerase sigma-70 factor (ECF subfamily)
MTVEALRRRRPETLAALLETYGRELQGVAYLILRDRSDAEDVVIETLLTAFERGGAIRDERALRAWLLRVATNHALSVRRRSGRVVRLSVVPDRADASDVGHESSTRAVVLRYYADLSVEEVAAALDKSPNTIKAQLQTALDRLRTHLADPVGTSVGEARHA